MGKFFNFKTLLTKLKQNRKAAFCVAAILFLVLIAIFASAFNKNQSVTQTQTLTSESADSFGSYEEFVEKRLTTILNSVKGISNVKVYISVGSTPKIVYAQSEPTSNQTNGTSVIFTKSGTTQTPVIISKTYPEIVGVLIVCKGLTQKLNIDLTNSLSLVLNVPVGCIQIMEGKWLWKYFLWRRGNQC